METIRKIISFDDGAYQGQRRGSAFSTASDLSGYPSSDVTGKEHNREGCCLPSEGETKQSDNGRNSHGNSTSKIDEQDECGQPCRIH